MARPGALHLALDLTAMPVLANIMRQQPLPRDVLEVIKIAARCPETVDRAERMTGKSAESIRQAAMLYLQSVLFAAGADHYRVLGVQPTAPHDQIREHMRWLMKWLHPDRQRNDWESAFAARVLVAWEALKSPDRRARYDRIRAVDQARSPSRRRQQPPRIPWISGPSAPRPVRWGLWRQLDLAAHRAMPALYGIWHQLDRYLRRKAGIAGGERRGESRKRVKPSALRQRPRHARPAIGDPNAE
jgi:hypothetical protein